MRCVCVCVMYKRNFLQELFMVFEDALHEFLDVICMADRYSQNLQSLLISFKISGSSPGLSSNQI